MKADSRDRRPQSWEHLLERDRAPQAGFRIGIAAACAIHAVIFAITWPTVAQAPQAEPERDGIPLVLANVRYPEPPPPEPVLVEEISRFEGPPVIPGPPEEIDTEPISTPAPPPLAAGPADGEVAVIDLPPAPPMAPVEREFVVYRDIEPPAVIHRVEPRYTEAARHAKVQGFVILELVIDTEGAVETVKVQRGLPLGLTESAVEAVQQWRFAPSTADGRPVAVRYILTVRFSLE